MRLPPSTAPLAVLLFAIPLVACGSNVPPAAEPALGTATSGPPGLVPARQALEKADILKTYPETMEPVAAERVLPQGPGCSFAFTQAGKPALVVRAPADEAAFATGIVKIHGELAELRAAQAGGSDRLRTGVTLAADGMQIIVRPIGAAEDSTERPRQADLEIRLREGLRRGWRGVYRCQG